MKTKTTDRLCKAYFKREFETKGAVRYFEIASLKDQTPLGRDKHKIGTIYFRKSIFNERYPKFVKCSFSEVEVNKFKSKGSVDE